MLSAIDAGASDVVGENHVDKLQKSGLGHAQLRGAPALQQRGVDAQPPAERAVATFDHGGALEERLLEAHSGAQLARRVPGEG